MTDRAWHALEPDAIYDELDTSADGLTSTEATRRLEAVGPNTLETGKTIRPHQILLHQFTSPLIYILLVAFVVTIAIDHLTDAIVIAAVLVINATIGFIQEYRAENAMAALASLVGPRARVRRNGSVTEVPSADLVPGDIVLLESGDIIPADLRLVHTDDLRIDNAILTGESAPVARRAEVAPEAAVVGDRYNMAFMGTSVVSGRAVGVVVETANDSQIGQIAGEMRQVERAPTPLQVRMHRFGNLVSVAILAAGALVFGIGLSQGIPGGDIFLLAVAIAVSAIPEGLPVVMTVALAVSVRRMANRNAIIRRLPAVETLGSCNVILSDKTGTITANRMTVRRVWTPTGTVTLEDDSMTAIDHGGDSLADGTWDIVPVLRAGVLANEATVEQSDNGDRRELGDPTDTAILTAGRRIGLDRDGLIAAGEIVDVRPFESDLRYSAIAIADDADVTTYVKGAPETVLDMCDDMAGPGDTRDLDRKHIEAAIDRFAADGLRVIAMASAPGNHADARPEGLTFLGFVGMMDPPRTGVTDAIAACRRAGISVKMVTGDHAETARVIARDVGIDAENVLTGSDLEAMDDATLSERLDDTAVFARISPTQKLRLVTLQQAKGDIVAVTGDGVNDAPALKAAHIGAAMGITGTDVAKEASEMVLTDDNFATIYAAVEEGRTVFSNIRKATSFLLATGIGLVVAIIAAFVLAILDVIPTEAAGAFPLLLLPAQALWLNVVNNGIQDVALAFEPGEAEQFERPPFDPKSGLLSDVLVERTVIVGLVLSVLALAVFSLEVRAGSPIGYAQTAALTMMVVSMAMFVLTCRSETRYITEKHPMTNPLLLVGMVVAFIVHVGALYIPVTQTLLGVQPIGLETWLRIVVIAPIIIVLVELHKRYRRA